MKKEYIVFNQTLAGYLMIHKFILKRMGKSDKNPNLNIFFFNESEDLLNRVNEFKKLNTN